MTLPWLAPSPPPDVRLLTLEELLRLWRANRSGVKAANTVLGSAAADEVCRRLSEGKR